MLNSFSISSRGLSRAKMPNPNCETCESSQNNKRKCENNANVQSGNKKRSTDPNECQQPAQSAHDFLKKLVHEQKLHAPTLFNNTNELKPENNRTGSSENDTNGKLSFYLGENGRFILELEHKPGGKRRNGGWIQTKGITWMPRPEEEKLINPIKQELKESETSRMKLKNLKRFSSQRETTNACSVVLFNFRINRRRDFKHFPRLNAYYLRKAARHPFSIDLFFFSKSEKCKTAPPSTKLVKKRTKRLNDLFRPPEFVNSTADNVKRWFDEVGSVKVKCEPDNASLPLPEWYLDPSKSQIPVNEMIGNPRPYLPAAPTHYDDKESNVNSMSEPLDLRTNVVRETKRDEWMKREAKEHPGNAFYVGLIPFPLPGHGEYSAPSAVQPWPCVSCPVVAYAPTVVNSYYYCCCFLPGCRSNCLCKTEGKQLTSRSSEIPKECDCATDLTNACNKKFPIPVAVKSDHQTPGKKRMSETDVRIQC
uniref:Uncharacterized protein n=1 Tax=Strigamia maritima TaxID=126957 RepID=T1JGP5_STRMM